MSDRREFFFNLALWCYLNYKNSSSNIKFANLPLSSAKVLEADMWHIPRLEAWLLVANAGDWADAEPNSVARKMADLATSRATGARHGVGAAPTPPERRKSAAPSLHECN